MAAARGPPLTVEERRDGKQREGNRRNGKWRDRKRRLEEGWAYLYAERRDIGNKQ